MQITAGIQRLEDEATVLLTRGERVESGVLRVGIRNLMPGMALIGAFQKRFPKIQVEVQYAIFSDIIDAVLEQRVDVGVLPNVPQDGRFISQVCLAQDVVALLPMNHPLVRCSRLHIADLLEEKLIFQKKGSATQRVIDAAFKKANVSPRPTLILETGSEVFEAVANGLGIGFIWRHGTSRKDGAAHIPVVEIDSTHEEVVFRRQGFSNAIVDMFFATASSVMSND